MDFLRGREVRATTMTTKKKVAAVWLVLLGLAALTTFLIEDWRTTVSMLSVLTVVIGTVTAINALIE